MANANRAMPWIRTINRAVWKLTIPANNGGGGPRCPNTTYSASWISYVAGNKFPGVSLETYESRSMSALFSNMRWNNALKVRAVSPCNEIGYSPHFTKSSNSFKTKTKVTISPLQHSWESSQIQIPHHPNRKIKAHEANSCCWTIARVNILWCNSMTWQYRSPNNHSFFKDKV